MIKYKDVPVTIDIETGYNTTINWRPGQQFVDHKHILKERMIISFSWKFKSDKKPNIIFFDINTQNDKKVCEKAKEIILSASAVIGQNSDRFDINFINARLAYHNIPGIHPTLLNRIDTMKLAKQTFDLNSYSLDYMLRFFGKPGKIKMDLDDWKAILEKKDKKALNKMGIYNKKDVADTEWLFFNKIGPNAVLPIHLGMCLGLIDRDACKLCGSKDIMKDGTVQVMSTGLIYPKFECKICHSKWRAWQSINSSRKSK